MPGGQGSPVVTQTWKHEIASSSVEVTFTAFADMNMLVFTDTGSMGTILRARYGSILLCRLVSECVLLWVPCFQSVLLREIPCIADLWNASTLDASTLDSH